MKPRVVYWNNIPAPYMVERFNAVARRGNVDFEAWFSFRTETGRSWDIEEKTWEFAYSYLPTFPRGRVNDDPIAGHGVRGYSSIALPSAVLRAQAPDVLVSLYAEPWYLVGSAIAALRGVRTAYWVEVTFDSVVTRRRWKEALKASLLPRADAIFTPGHDGRRFAMRYGVSPERIMILPHVIDATRYARDSALEDDERQLLRRNLGLNGVVFIYVGRLWERKGLGSLLDAFAVVQRTASVEVSLLLVGDGDYEPTLRAKCARDRIRGVVFAGFRSGDELSRLYGAADVFVFPTTGDTFGLVMSEAMACGLPVVTSASVGEIATRISDGENGFVVGSGEDALAERMSVLAHDSELRRRMGAASRERVAGESPEQWAAEFEWAVQRVLKMPRSPRWRKGGS